MRRGYAALVVAVLAALGGCSSLTFAPNRMGAEHECATGSANLPQYNDCMEQVDGFYTEFEEHQRRQQGDGS